MAHGKKRWIETYDGRLKKSNDKTWSDKKSDLHRWKGWERPYKCPDCREIWRPYDEHNAKVKSVEAVVEAEYYEEFPDMKKDYDDPYTSLGYSEFRAKYNIDRWNHKRRWMNERMPINYARPPWHDDQCDACAAKDRAQDKFWRTAPRRSKKWYKQTRNRISRAEDHRICRKALLDEDAEDLFTKSKKDVAWWLD
jgi:hypothetical protein